MSTAPEVVSIWVTLIPVIVGGVIGLAGGLIGPWLLETRKQEADRKKKRAEKFEELVSTLYEHKHWLDVARGIRVFGNEGSIGLSPFAKVQAISAVYFPEFRNALHALDIEADKYEIWMFKAASKRMKGELPVTDDGTAAYTTYLQKFHDLQKDLREYAQREFQ